VTCSAFSTIVGGWCILLIIGAQLAWGNQSTYIASYFYHLGWPVTMEQFYIVQPLIVLFATFFFPLGVYLSDKFGSRIVLTVAGTFALSCVLFCSYLTNPTHFIILYSFGFGVGKGLMYSAALQAGWSHLPGRKGFASGFIISGFGFGGFFFGIITNLLSNPQNIPVQGYEVSEGQTENFFPVEVAERVPQMLR
jgi:MFS transporter, OFA family, oxalate/formate antiporter